VKSTLYGEKNGAKECFAVKILSCRVYVKINLDPITVKPNLPQPGGRFGDL
jgi:hypothetical protein